MMSIDQDEGHGYNHAFKYNPDGMGAGYGKTNFFTFQWNHLLTNTMFYDLKLSNTNNYSGGYLYENPLIAIMSMINILKVLVQVFSLVGKRKIMKKGLLII